MLALCLCTQLGQSWAVHSFDQALRGLPAHQPAGRTSAHAQPPAQPLPLHPNRRAWQHQTLPCSPLPHHQMHTQKAPRPTHRQLPPPLLLQVAAAGGACGVTARLETARRHQAAAAHL